MSEINKDKIRSMKSSKRLILSKQEKFWHYSVVPFILIVPILTTYGFVKDYLGVYEGVRTPSEMIGGYLFVIPAILFFVIQWNRLKFKTYKTKVTDNEFETALKKTANELGWSIEQSKNGFVRAHRTWSWSSSWGELITIIYEEDQLLINSICDPNAPFISVVSYGWNKKNIKTFIRNIQVYDTH